MEQQESTCRERRLLRQEPERARLPAELKATLKTLDEWPSRTRMQRPESTSQRRRVWSSEPERARLPAELKATLKTLAEWPSRTRMQRPESTSQRRSVLSSEPERASLPSGLNATDRTESVWPNEIVFSSQLGNAGMVSSSGIKVSPNSSARTEIEALLVVGNKRLEPAADARSRKLSLSGQVVKYSG